MKRDDWLATDPARQAPEVEFGSRWTREPGDPFHRLSWNSGTGELYLTDTTSDSIVAELGISKTPTEVRAAFPALASRGARPGGIYYLAAIASSIGEGRAMGVLLSSGPAGPAVPAGTHHDVTEALKAWSSDCSCGRTTSSNAKPPSPSGTTRLPSAATKERVRRSTSRCLPTPSLIT